MALDKLIEQAVPLGMWRSGDLEAAPPGSAYDIVGLLQDDGEPFRRGGSTYKSNAALGAAGLLSIGDFQLPAGQRTIFGAASGWRVLAADDATPTTIPTLPAPSVPRRLITVNGFVFIDGGLGGGFYAYAGSRKSAVYTSTITLTKDRAIVSGAGFTANVDAGMFLAPSATQQPYVVRSVDSNNQLTLDRPWAEATVTASLTLAHIAFYDFASVVVPDNDKPAVYADGYGAIANRLVSWRGSFLFFAPVGNWWPGLTTAPYTSGWALTDRHEFPASIIGAAPIRDTLLVFTGAGVNAVSNMSLDLVDAGGNPQQSNQLVNSEIVLWDRNGLAPWAGSVIVPATDGVWLMDSVSAPQRISDPVEDLYLSYVRAGYRAGLAEVYAGHYLLPILNGLTWVDTLVCRLRVPRGGGGPAWSRLAGSGAQVVGFAERQSSSPLLLGGSRLATSRVIDATKFFAPAAAVKSDADGTAQSFVYTTRSISTGNMVANTVRRVRARYALVDAASDNPTVTCEASYDNGVTWVTLNRSDGSGTTAPESDGSSAYVWDVRRSDGRAAKVRSVMFRFTCSSPAASLSFKSVEILLRHSGRY